MEDLSPNYAGINQAQRKSATISCHTAAASAQAGERRGATLWSYSRGTPTQRLGQATRYPRRMYIFTTHFLLLRHQNHQHICPQRIRLQPVQLPRLDSRLEMRHHLRGTVRPAHPHPVRREQPSALDHRTDLPIIRQQKLPQTTLWELGNINPTTNAQHDQSHRS